MKLRLVFLCLAAGGLTGCGKSPSAGPADDRPLVVATTTLVADLARAVGGEAVRVEGLMGPGVDPHLYKPTGTDARRLRDAKVLFYNGLHLEGRMTEVLERQERAHALAEAVPVERLITGGEGGAAADPHVWGDAGLWAECVAVVVAGLSEALPEQRAAFEQRGQAVRERLRALDAWVRERVAALPPERRVLVTSHDAFAYFGRAYGFEVLGVQGISTVSEAGLADVARLVDVIKERGVRAVFVESSVPPATMERISQDSGARIGGELFSDALGVPGEMRQVGGEEVDVGTYEGMLRFNVSTIVEALK